MNRIFIIGSLNLDRVWRTPVLPRPGHTVLADRVHWEFGGKGANQAVAAAGQGAAVSFIASAGDDEDGRRYCDRLRKLGVDVSGIRLSAHAPTGSAQIFVDPAGENSIAVHPGANGEL